MKKEIWKPIFDGVYAVSTLGRVKRVARHSSITKNGGVLKPQLRGRYYCVNISLAGKVQHKSVHLLVAQAFLGPIPQGHNVDHVRPDKSNNTLGNLEYVTHAENVARAVRLKIHPHGERHYGALLTADQVIEIRRRYQPGEGGRLAREFGVARKTVQKLIKRRSWRHI